MTRFQRFISAMTLVVASPLLCHLGCSTATAKAIEAANSPQDDAELAKCVAEMRSARDGGMPAGAAYNVYYQCTVDGGLRE